mmetsp:Transcript_16325/g.30910  ORF Transcript_16325/g.30910 Transcript_16325/m.30910 type:complete len:90 (-) Transcript_16325:18-287(-)
MESFFLGETLKYLYLLFDPDSDVDLNKVSLNFCANVCLPIVVACPPPPPKKSINYLFCRFRLYLIQKHTHCHYLILGEHCVIKRNEINS